MCINPRIIGKYLVYAVGLYGAVLAYMALKGLYQYWRLDTTVVGKVQETHYQEVSSSKYEVFASYTYIYGGRPYKGESSQGKPYQLNQYAAEKAAEKLKHSSPVLYISRRHPEISSLTRKFPVLHVVNAVVTLGIW